MYLIYHKNSKINVNNSVSLMFRLGEDQQPMKTLALRNSTNELTYLRKEESNQHQLTWWLSRALIYEYKEIKDKMDRNYKGK